MSQYAHLSTLDPEYAALRASMPVTSAMQTQTDIPTIRATGVKMRAARPAPSLPADHDYRIENRQISVEGGNITFGIMAAGVLTLFPSLNPQAAENVKTLLASPSKSFLVGGPSAGGNLAAVMALRARDDAFFITWPLTGQLLQYPNVCHPDAYPERYKSELLSLEQNKDAPVFGKKEIYWFLSLLGPSATNPDFSPLLATSHAGLPPACVQVCGMDPLRDEGILYEKVLKEQGVKTKLHIYPGVPHGVNAVFSELKASKQFENAFREAIGWMIGLSAHRSNDMQAT